MYSSAGDILSDTNLGIAGMSMGGMPGIPPDPGCSPSFGASAGPPSQLRASESKRDREMERERESKGEGERERRDRRERRERE